MEFANKDEELAYYKKELEKYKDQEKKDSFDYGIPNTIKIFRD